VLDHSRLGEKYVRNKNHIKGVNFTFSVNPEISVEQEQLLLFVFGEHFITKSKVRDWILQKSTF